MTHGGHRLGKAGWATPGRLVVATGGLCGAGDEPRGQILGVRGAPRSLWGREWPRSVFTHRVWVPNVGLDARRGWEKPLPASPAAPGGVSAPGSAPGLVTSNPLCPTGVHAVRPRAPQGWHQVRAWQRDKLGSRKGGGHRASPQPPALVQRERRSQGDAVKILIAFILPIASHSPAGQHTRTHAHNSRTLTHAGSSLPQLGGTGLQ